ncbi:MAG: hypothetical protein AAFN77_21505 [Planctomycetota bacterium]
MIFVLMIIRAASNFVRRFRRTPGQRPGPPTSLPESTGVMVHALHKSASMFLHQFFEDLCRRSKTDYVSIHHPDADQQTVAEARETSFVWCPLRTFDVSPTPFPRVRRCLRIFQVRDPRDILVSEYFSLGWRHSDANWSADAKRRRAEIQKMTIDEFVLTESHTGKPPLVDRMAPVCSAMASETACVVKYETMVTDFSTWLGQVIPHCGFSNAERLTRFLANKYRNEFTPDKDSNGHKRAIQPGDHRNQLQPETIDALNQRFGLILGELGYASLNRS